MSDDSLLVCVFTAFVCATVQFCSHMMILEEASVSQTFAVGVRDGALAEAGVRVQDLLRCLMSQ